MRRMIVSLLAIGVILNAHHGRAQPTQKTPYPLDNWGWPVVPPEDLSQMAANTTRWARPLDLLKNSLDYLLHLKGLVGRDALKETTFNVLGTGINKELEDQAISNPVADLTSVSTLARAYETAVNIPDLMKTPDQQFIEAVMRLRGSDCSSGARFICNPVNANTNECTGDGDLILPGRPGLAGSALLAQCDRIGPGGQAISVTVILKENLRKQHIRRDARGIIYDGQGYSTPCIPCGTRICLFGICP